MSDDYGKHLMGVEDLLQKHALLEAAVAAQNERMSAVNQKADDYYSRILEQSGTIQLFLLYKERPRINANSYAAQFYITVKIIGMNAIRILS